MNKDGLPVSNNPKAIHEELFRGTGSVMGTGASIFMQNESITEKYIITSKDNGLEPPTDKQFVAGRYKEALGLFQEWLEAWSKRGNEIEHWLMLTLVGKDRPGIVAKISQFLFDMQGILGETSMTRLGDNFTIMLLGASKNLIFASNLF